MWFEIRVFGCEGIDNDNEAGWGLYLRTNSYEEAEKKLGELLDSEGWDNVLWDWDSDIANDFAPEDEPEDWGYNEDEGFDPYEGCYTWDC